jgi:hypothetical protein
MLTPIGRSWCRRIYNHENRRTQRYVRPTPEAVEGAFVRLETLNRHAGRESSTSPHPPFHREVVEGL